MQNVLPALFLVSPVAYSLNVPVPGWHPDIQDALLRGLPTPSGHPLVNQLFGNFDGEDEHPNIDREMAKGERLDNEHPNVNNYITYEPLPPRVRIPHWHPSIQEGMEMKWDVPAGHPDVDVLLDGFMPPSHPSVNSAISEPLPAWHPKEALFTVQDPIPSRYEVPSWHPSVDMSLDSPLPPGHPEVQPMLASVMPPSHPNIDALYNGTAPIVLPNWHPKIDPYLNYAEASKYIAVELPYWHPSIQGSWDEREGLPSDHPPLNDWFAPMMPASHPNIDTLWARMSDPTLPALPQWHPNLDDLVQWRQRWGAGDYLGVHLAVLLIVAFVGRVMYRCCKSSKPNRVQQMKEMQAFGLSDGQARAVALAHKTGAFSVNESWDKAEAIVRQAAGKSSEKGEKGAGDQPGAPVGVDVIRVQTERPARGEEGFEQEEEQGAVRSATAPHASALRHRLPARDIYVATAQRLHAQHRRPLYDYGKYAGAKGRNTMRIPRPISPKMRSKAMKAKKASCAHSCWVCLTRGRLPGTQWTMGNLLFVFVYVLLNAWCLFLPKRAGQSTTIGNVFSINKDPDWGRGLGSLAAANTMVLIIPATRNSVLTWMLGLPFDHVVLYHRWIGRWALALSAAHFALFFNDWLDHYDEKIYVYGLLAGLCGAVIFVSSLNCVRRRAFNIFFYAHYAFVGFFAFGLLHVRETRPFLMVGVLLYALDRLLRMVWWVVPRRTLLFTNKGEQIAQVRFPKNPLTVALKKHKIGQYYFVNFPAVSQLEWHPYSVSSSPREIDVELHIRALGDHTNKVVALAKQCAASGKAIKVRTDGPYGCHDFNYRRYPVLLLVGGGVGITPVMGMLKDVYNVGNYSKEERKRVIPHAIQTVYVTWVVRYPADADCFLRELRTCLEASRQKQMPPLVVWLYVSRGKPEQLAKPLLAGRPKFPEVFRSINEAHPGKASLVFACGPGAMVNELWDLSIQRTRSGARVDFHHETFEF